MADAHDPAAQRPDLATLARTDPAALPERLQALPARELAELALALPAHERLEVLLHAPKPMRAVRALPEGDLYLTVRELGPADALPLLALASAAQIQHLLDLEAWRRDTFDPDRAGAWVALLLEAGEPVLARFLKHADDSLLALLFQRWLRVRQVDTDEDPSVHGTGHTEAGDERGLVAPDGYHLLRPMVAEHAPAARRLADAFFRGQRERYGRTLQAALWEMPAELEEQALHWRESRLEERGFLPWEESLSAYASPSGSTERAAPLPPDDPDGIAASRTALRVLEPGGLLARAASAVAGPDRETVLHEVASLANRLLVADAADLGDPSAHVAALRRAAAYAGLGLAARGAHAAEAGADVLRTVPVLELFREGFGRVAALRSRAEGLVRSGWAKGHPRALELLDAPLRPRVLALLSPRPLHVPAADDLEAVGLRDFRTLEEVEEARVALDLAEVLGRVLVERMGLDVAALLARPAPTPSGAPRLSAVWLTALAWHAVRGEVRASPLPRDVTADFLARVAWRGRADARAGERATEDWIEALGAEVGLDARERAALRAFGRACLDKLDEECGALDPRAPVDPRQVSCLLLEGDEP